MKIREVSNVTPMKPADARRPHARKAGKSFGVCGAARRADPCRMIDDWLAAAHDDGFSRRKSRGAKIGIADSVEDQTMRWQGQVRSVIFSVKNCDVKNAVIENVLCGNIADLGGNQHQERDTSRVAAAGLADDRLARKTLAPMPLLGFALADDLGNSCQSAVRVCQRAVNPERGFKLQPRALEVTIVKKKASQVDPSGGVQRPMADQLFIGGARRGVVTASVGETSQPVQCSQMIRNSPQKHEISTKGLVIFPFDRKVPRLVEKRLGPVVGLAFRREFQLGLGR